ncbi:hypothetical protein [Streptomyces sp. NPDC050704]|uniref:hypothetical protein n=1 Tax=Streptomyces sp. NPDC050704 TaxID=3157219 RepID=UPI0034354404
MAPGDSLAGAGILDGATLYRHDQRAAKLSDLTVTDLDEQVADAQEDGSLWSARRRAQCVLVAGLLGPAFPAVARSRRIPASPLWNRQLKRCQSRQLLFWRLCWSAPCRGG